MFKLNKSKSILVISLLILTAFVLPAFSVDLPFDPNDYTFLVYDPTPNYHYIQDAMEDILGRPLNQSEIRTSANPVTPTDLATHDILIVGFNRNGYTGGLHTDDLSAGITGRILLTGHDLDHHESSIPAARTMLIQAINYVLEGGGTGLVAMECTSNYSYLPKDDWGIDSIYGDGEDVNEFTPEGLASGVFDGLTPDVMSGWGTSYHNTFDINEQDSEFVPFEKGGYDYNDIITIARTTPPIDVTLTKTDGLGENECVFPSTEDANYFINYTICYIAGEDVNDVTIVDTLPDGVEFKDANGPYSYDYNSVTQTETITWTLGNLDANDANCFNLNVRVANNAPQGDYLTNSAKMYSGETLIRTESESTLICCVDNVVYVDQDAVGGAKNGSNWDNAYLELRDALVAVSAGLHPCASQIWVADGNYTPTEANDPSPSNKTFQMLDGIDVYGHFFGKGTYETMLCQRRFADPNSETILTGDINGDNTAEVQYVVTAANFRLDGFTVKKGTYGVSASACSPTIENCIIKENDSYGIYFGSNANAAITNCFINDNDYGIYCNRAGTVNMVHCTVASNTAQGVWAFDGAINAADSIFSSNGSGIKVSGCNLTINGCDFSGNYNGIYLSGITHMNAKKCIIQHNVNYGVCVQGSDGNSEVSSSIIRNNYIGVNMNTNSIHLRNNLIYRNSSNGISAGYNPNIRNNTIAYNGGYGITGSSQPAVSNNIIYGNTTGGLYGTFTNVHYNCLQSGDTGDSTNTIGQNPHFKNADTNDFHLTSASTYCINAGNPSFTPDPNETDIDGENRVMLNYVDMGADEFCPYDLSPDGIVNFLDFTVFAKAWGTHTGQTDFNDRCNFYDDGATDYINYRDLEIFCDYWLTPADWEGIGGDGAYFAEAECPLQGGEMMMMSMQSQSSMVSPANTLAGSVDSTESAEVVEEAFDVNGTLNWLDNLWETDEEIRNSIDVNDWQEFLNAIKSNE
jgi:hypothetical protein